eukprot:Hpha_TRINITY_DN26741_c0_g1::TRINITY_DN26741_c0_g1_i1::g.138925::m.138925
MAERWLQGFEAPVRAALQEARPAAVLGAVLESILRIDAEGGSGGESNLRAAEVTAAAFALHPDRVRRSQALVKCIIERVGATAVRRTVEETAPQAAGGGSHNSRFADAGSGKDHEAGVQFHAEGRQVVQESDLPQQVALWEGPEGRHWTQEEGEDMIGTAQGVAARSRGTLKKGALAVAVYTLQVSGRVVWL